VQLWGFVFMGIGFLFFAAVMRYWHEHTVVTVAAFSVLLFFLDGGPYLTTFVLPQESFPMQIRSTFIGISAASGTFLRGKSLALTVLIWQAKSVLGWAHICFRC
jgi:hypothetical protein